MITRRRFASLFALAPAIAAADIPEIAGKMGASANKTFWSGIDLTQAALPPHLRKLVHCFSKELNDMGRGHELPFEEILKIKGELKQYGFVPFTTPSQFGADSQFIPLYGSSGAPVFGLWFGFVRKHDGKNECVAFEYRHLFPDELKESLAKAGFKTLYEAINS